MATIESRPTPDGKPAFRVKIRIKGRPAVSETFARRTDAKRWAQDTEADIRAGRYFNNATAKDHTVAELIDKYIAEILPTKPRNARSQKSQLLWWKRELGHLLLANLTAGEIGQRRDLLLSSEPKPGRRRSPATVVRYLAVLSHVLSTAVKEWDWLDDNPMRKVRKPKEPRGRVRSLSKAEVEKLLDACKQSKNPHLHCITVLAVSTGMRQGEILSLRRSQIDLDKGRLLLTDTKNGDARAVYPGAFPLAVLMNHMSGPVNRDMLVFPGLNPDKPVEIKKAWGNALERAGIKDFRFHDLRHCAASFLLESGASLGILAEVLGHRTLQMVKRYAHLSESHSAKVVLAMNKTLFGDA